MRRWEDWLDQARYNLEHAKGSIGLKHYDWACFAAQQAAEMAVKAVFRGLGADAWGHSVSQLLEELPSEYQANNEILSRARELDRHYIPARYPNGLPAGTPRKAFDEREAQEAIKAARTILRFSEDILATIKG